MPADLAARAHRPWPPPERAWVMQQSWHDLLFAHWPMAPAALRPLLPAGLELDTVDGEAWIGVVPFRMTDVRLRGLPAWPGTGAFPELNVRTYVTRDGMPGVWFFSLDAASAVAVAVARRWFRLPYYRARMRCSGDEEIEYASERIHRGAPFARFGARYGPTGPVARARPGTLEHWLTERYCLYAPHAFGRLARAQIHHAPWPLQPAAWDPQRDSITMNGALGLSLPARAPLLHFARQLDVLVWSPQPVETESARAAGRR